MLVTPHPARRAALFMRRRPTERGAAPDNGVAVERREAPPPSHGGGTPRKRSGRADRKACPKEASQASWRLPALHPLAPRGKEKGEGRARVHKNRASGAVAKIVAGGMGGL